MKKSILITTLVTLLFSCNSTEDKGSSLVNESQLNAQNEQAKQDSLLALEDSNENKGNCINLWTKLGLYTSPIKPHKWIKSVDFGRNMTILKDTIVNEKTYYFVKIIEGEEGWVNGYLVAKDAEIAVATKKTTIYSAPDPLTITDKSIELGDFVVIYKEKVGDYWRFETKEKKLSGYLKSNDGISIEENDLAAGQLFSKIIAKEDASEKIDALTEFAENETYQNTSFAREAKKLVEEYLTNVIEEGNAIIKEMPDKELLRLLAEQTARREEVEKANPRRASSQDFGAQRLGITKEEVQDYEEDGVSFSTDVENMRK